MDYKIIYYTKLNEHYREMPPPLITESFQESCMFCYMEGQARRSQGLSSLGVIHEKNQVHIKEPDMHS